MRNPPSEMLQYRDVGTGPICYNGLSNPPDNRRSRSPSMPDTDIAPHPRPEVDALLLLASPLPCLRLSGARASQGSASRLRQGHHKIVQFF